MKVLHAKRNKGYEEKAREKRNKLADYREKGGQLNTPKRSNKRSKSTERGAGDTLIQADRIFVCLFVCLLLT